MPKNDLFPIVAALHIGAKYSGCAFSYKFDPTNVFICMEDNCTSVLIDSTGRFHSFGFKAEDHFALLVLENKHTGWRLFIDLTRQLQDQKNLSEKTAIEDYGGKSYPAIEIFTMTIKYLRDEIMDMVKRKSPDGRKTDVQYVIPLPAMWNFSGEQFIRMAAGKAGIDQYSLDIVFEDQAAAKWCERKGGPASCLEGSKYMSIYLGDASADIVVRKRMTSGNIVEENCLRCGQWNETYTDQMCSLYLANMVGKEAWEEFRKNEVREYLYVHRKFANLMQHFESDREYLRIRIDKSLMANISENNRTADKVNLHSTEIISWFNIIIQPVLKDIKALVFQDKMKDIRTIVLTGVSARSKYIQDKLRKELPEISLIVPNDSCSAALKGAVLSGHNPDNSKQFMVAAAFDLGSTYSGYAYSYTYDPTKVLMNQNWFSGGSSSSLSTLKTSSSVLLDDKGRFHSFGYEAENKYAALTKENTMSGWRLFRQFKLLNTKYKARISTVDDMHGQPFPAKTIFSMAIRYLHEHLLKALKLKSPDILEVNIRYVITVPTTWGPEAKQVMREVAKEAGIDNYRLTIVFEDQAAAKWCTRNDGPAPDLKTTGSKYMIIDLGGGTSQLTVHQRVADSNIKVLHTASLEKCSGIRVDQQFLKYLDKILEGNALTNCQRKYSDDYFKIIRAFEALKRNWVINSQLELQLPTALLNITRKQNSTMTVNKSGKLQISCSEASSWFRKIIKHLAQKVQILVNEGNIKGTQIILLVGALAESKYIQQKLREELPTMTLIFPEDAGMAVLKGGVLCGHDRDHGYMTSLVVAAFDFGTTYSGYAYSYRHNPTDVHFNKSWYTGGASNQLVTLKTPTCVLLDDIGRFHSFGFEAEDTFAELTMTRLNKGWRLFRRFKMQLHNIKNLSRDLIVKDIEGNPYPAMDIIAMALRYLHNHLLEAFSMKEPFILETDFQYIITVPAIWDVAAKQFMREAAIKAGIDDRRLALALESEAAAIWCGGFGIQCLSSDLKYILIDLGGGTADITVFTSLSDDNLRVIHKATGGAWGGIYVDKNYLAFLDKILGNGVLDELNREHLYDYYFLIREFETKKRLTRFGSNSGCIVQITGSMKAIVSKRQSEGQAGRTLDDWLPIDSCEVKSWFEQPISSLIEHVKELLTGEQLKDIKHVLLVGGFAESSYVQDRLKNELPGLTLIVPDEAGLAVLRGAVLYGHNPGIVSSRVMSHTYGISVYNNFDEKQHPLEKRVHAYGEWRVENCFKVFVRVNEEIAVVHEVSHTTSPLSDSSWSSFEVYKTTSKEPKYTTDPGCELLGSLTLKNINNVSVNEQKHIVTFMFGHSELLVTVKHTLTGEVETRTLDCLQ